MLDAIRSEQYKTRHTKIFTILCVGALVLGVILQVIVVVVSPLAQVFSLVPLTGIQWLYTILIAVAPIPIVEIQKAVNGYKFGRVVYAKNN